MRRRSVGTPARSLGGPAGWKSSVPCRYERIQGFATAVEPEVSNLQAETLTFFKLRNVRDNSGVPDDLFSVASVQKGR
jgi:hypothetical protein